jgi:hypothetical protein
VAFGGLHRSVREHRFTFAGLWHTIASRIVAHFFDLLFSPFSGENLKSSCRGSPTWFGPLDRADQAPAVFTESATSALL